MHLLAFEAALGFNGMQIAKDTSHGLVMHGTVDLGRRDAHAAVSVEAHLERGPTEMTAMFVGDHCLPCR